MPETLEPPTEPKSSFAQRFAATRPKNENELRAMNAGATKPAAAATAPEPPKEEPKPVAPPAAAASATAPTSDPDAEILAGKRAPKSEDFKRIKTAAAEAAKERDAINAKVAEYEKELGELRQKPKHNAELIAQIEKERDDYKTKYEHITLEFKPEFHAEYNARLSAVLQSVKGLVPSDREEKLAQVIQMPDSEWKRRALEEITEDLSPVAMARVLRADERAMEIMGEKQARLAKASETINVLAEERKKQSEARNKARQDAFDAAIAESREANPLLQVKDGDIEHNSAVEADTKLARALFMGEVNDPKQLAQAALQAAINPRILRGWKTALAENQALKEQLAKLQSASPGLSAGEASKTGSDGKKMSFTERMASSAL